MSSISSVCFDQFAIRKSINGEGDKLCLWNGLNLLIFFVWVRAGLWEKEVRLDSLGGGGFEEVYRLASKQAVVGLFAAGLEQATDAKAPKEITMRIMSTVLSLEQRNLAMNAFIADLFQKMHDASIKALLVKGQGIAQCYERPQRRACGNVDLLFRSEARNFTHKRKAMETITICSGAAQGVAPVIVFRLEDGAQTFYHSTGIEALPHEAERDQVLRDKLEIHKLAMCKAYTLMQLKRMDMNDRIFEMQVGRVLQNRMVQTVSSGREPMYGRYLRYVEEMHKVGAVGESRYTQLQSKARKLWRFLVINGLTGLSAREFDSSLLLEYRQFVYDEYKYVPLYPQLYPSGGGRRAPKKRCKNNTVVSDLLALKAFFSELEDTGEIRRSPFRKLSGEKRRSVMHVEYDEPFYLRADEFRQILSCPVPAELQGAKDMFVLNCALGCRIGDLKKLTMEKVAISDEGIPYVHYIPSKTARVSKREVMTPLIKPAYEIIRRTHFGFNGHNPNYEKQLYNKALRRLLKFCGIDRPVCLYDPEVGDNVYRPLYEVASSKLARKTHVDMLNKVQINYYAAGLHREGSKAVFRYTSLELADRFALLNAAFGEEGYRV